MTDPTGALKSLGQSIVAALPPAMLLLVLLNVAFGAALVWFLDDQLKARDLMAQRLFDRCMEIALKNAP